MRRAGGPAGRGGLRPHAGGASIVLCAVSQGGHGILLEIGFVVSALGCKETQRRTSRVGRQVSIAIASAWPAGFRAAGECAATDVQRAAPTCSAGLGAAAAGPGRSRSRGRLRVLRPWSQGPAWSPVTSSASLEGSGTGSAQWLAMRRVTPLLSSVQVALGAHIELAEQPLLPSALGPPRPRPTSEK